jgi:hypothetical protein
MNQCTYTDTDRHCTRSADHGGPHHMATNTARWCMDSDPKELYGCSLPPDHDGDHEAWDGHRAGITDCFLSAWPQETKSGPANVTTFAELRDLVIDLEARETETRLRHAERLENLAHLIAGAATDDMFAGLGSRLDAFEERLQRLRDDTRDAAAAAGEALERTKGLQVPEILRRLGQTERRVNLMDGGRVARETPPDDRLLNAVTELTTVMREAVAAQREGAVLVQRGLDALTPPEVCGKRIPFSQDVFCDREEGHDGAHHPLAGSALKPEPRTCTATLTEGVDELQRVSACTRLPGHPGMHREVTGKPWLAS